MQSHGEIAASNPVKDKVNMLFFVGIFIPVSQLRYSLLELETKPISAVPPTLYIVCAEGMWGRLGLTGAPISLPILSRSWQSKKDDTGLN